MKSTNLLYIHHVNFYVQDAAFWQKWFEFCLDFQAIATTDSNHTHTIILQQEKVQIRVSQALNRHSPVAKYLEKHPQGIGEIGFAVKEPAPNLIPPWGDIIHTFVPYSTVIEQNQKIYQNQESSNLFTAIDHVVVNVAEISSTAAWYENMGLHQGDRFTIQTPYSALRSVVMKSVDHDPTHPIQVPLNEPSTPNSQIQDFLNYNNGAGVQHLALLTDDISATVAKLKQRGIDFLETSPPILIERQNIISGQTLMQIFTKPIFNEPTFFLEIIQRQNLAHGFGERNFQALFEAVERQQLLKTA
ncbi:4-hydroxyphenylpyruvate dioxygenase/hemolysin-like protein [Synechococcus sp. PCC 7502]|uniref:4-hydroxyphenylpyruvate dioxygenase family protein n=1 Tax=Synechococcus sp. PCC 7502 TaxID=1173263 RepID=UPI00029F98ED|nr:VOC family protein [Synechococcus sp. PCC 7502]AFY73035.1 4-hydroxyphenylpyruvate dioxygenase/hemolysin-like protein [Synechococcus sp. PCC 7502]